jgi:vancomycin resistance protein YoaR
MQQAAPRTRQPEIAPLNPWPARILLLILWAGALLAAAALLMAVIATNMYRDTILPGVAAMGIPLGGLTEAEAAELLRERVAAGSGAIFTLQDGDQTWQFTAEQLGVSLDADAVASDAMSAGRGDGLIGGVIAQTLTWLNGEIVTPRLTYDQSAALAAVTGIAAEVNQAGASGGLVIDGLNVSATNAESARTLDIAATMTLLDAELTALDGGADIPLVIREAPASIAELDASAALARAALSGPITLFADDGMGNTLGPWTIQPEQIAALLDVQLVEQADRTYRYEVNLDLEPFRAYLETLAPGLISSPVDGRFHFNEGTRSLDIIQPSISGRRLNIDATLAEMERVAFLTGDQRTARMQFDYVQAAYHNTVSAADLGITEMVAEATTTFAGSSHNRRINIALATAKMDGVIVGPGEEFSFNKYLGELEADEGWVEAAVIFADRTGTGLGGGVCQVSTTIFRAAFSGGFTIIERNSHGYRVGFYEQGGFPPGLDAAIFTPERDFRFQNDTPHHLLIEASIYPATDQLQFRFYSTNTGRIVEIEAPRVANRVPPVEARYEANPDVPAGQAIQVDYSAEGADVNVTRTVKAPDGTIIRKDNIFTHYLPWGAIYQVNPADGRLSQ